MSVLQRKVSRTQLTVLMLTMLALIGALSACNLGKATEKNTKVEELKKTAVVYKQDPQGPTGSEVLPEPLKTAKDWEQDFPEIYKTYMANSIQDNNYPGAYPSRDYTEMYPDIQYIFKGYGYAKDYTVPNGHTSSLETVAGTTRPHPKASCFACKTPQYMTLEKKYGEAFYKMSFEEIAKEVTEPISCYDCHENTPGEMHINRSGFVKALKDYDIKVDPRLQACAQCHNDYYMDPETGQPVHPYEYGVNPDGMLKHYNEKHVVDFVHPDSGVEVAQVQHPDYEAFHSSPHAQAGLVCADCHMAKEDGYTSHTWTSPFKSDTIMNNVCLSCHDGETKDSLITKVNDLQAEIDGVQKEVSAKLVKVHQSIAEKKDGMDADSLAKVRDLVRSAQFYWCYFFAQNGDGIHNPQESRDVLKKASDLIEEANSILNK